MATFSRKKRTNVDAAPNQFEVVSDGGISISLVEIKCTNPLGNEDVYVWGYNNTSGVVTIGTTVPDYGPISVPADTQVVSNLGTEQNPLFFFTRGMTFAATTQSQDNSSISSTLDITIELTYYK